MRDEPDFQPEGGEVDVMLSTDILSEGQNLQQAQAVLSFDMPWNPQRVVQRNGRVIRLRSPHDTAYLYTLLPQQGDLDRLLELEAKLQAKIMAANASVGMETPVLADVEMESRTFADLSTFVERLARGDTGLLDEQENSGESGSAFAGELFRAQLRRAAEEGEVNRLKELPWGIGAAFVQQSRTLMEPAVFFACRTRRDERYWRMVSRWGDILSREDLTMLRLIDPQGQPGCPIPDGIDLERLFSVAAADICAAHNACSIPKGDLLRFPPASAGRWTSCGHRTRPRVTNTTTQTRHCQSAETTSCVASCRNCAATYESGGYECGGLRPANRRRGGEVRPASSPGFQRCLSRLVRTTWVSCATKWWCRGLDPVVLAAKPAPRPRFAYRPYLRSRVFRTRIFSIGHISVLALILCADDGVVPHSGVVTNSSFCALLLRQIRFFSLGNCQDNSGRGLPQTAEPVSHLCHEFVEGSVQEFVHWKGKPPRTRWIR